MSHLSSSLPAAAWAERINYAKAFLRRRYLIILICLLAALPFAGLYLY